MLRQILFIGLLIPSGAALAEGGSIKGTATLTGPAPTMEMLKRQTDPYCAKTPMRDESVVKNGNGTLRNVLVYVKNGPASAPPKAQAKIEQKSCMYHPRVQGMVAGQTLLVHNGDQTLHNVHTFRGASTLFNQAQVPNTPDIEKKFSDAGAMLKFKCDVHSWMAGFVWVQNNPYFAVTDETGAFEIKNVPPGTYTVKAWHERFGTKSLGEVTVAADQPAMVKVSYSGSESGE